MELLEKTLKSISSPVEVAKEEAKKRLDNLAKPIGSLGQLEEIVIKMAGITGNIHNKIDKKGIVAMCGDNGVVEEGVSACPQVFTMILTENMTKGFTGVSVLSKMTNTDLTIVDIGLKEDIENSKVLKKKVNYGTKNFTKGPSMTYEEAVKAIEVGIEVGDNLFKEGYDILGTGELGIGNTTTAAAVLSAFTGFGPEITSGKGAGLTEEQYQAKKNAINQGLKVNKPDSRDPIDVISKVGGFDIAGMCGVFLSAAKNRKPVVIDGFISSAAALSAVKFNPFVREYIFPSHLSREPGAIYMMKELGLKPMLNLEMRLGEGSGCPLAFQVIDAALCIMDEMVTFEEASIDSKVLVDIR